MKKSIILFAAVLLTATVFAQSPEKMSYQTVIRNSSDDLVAESPVGIRVSIVQGSATGSAVFTETHILMTNANGLASLEVGVGNPPSEAFNQIDWSNGPYFIKSEIDPTGGTNYTLTGSTELLSVPYALFAQKAGNTAFSTSDNVTSNTEGNYTEDDFVFGSPSLENDGNFDHDTRMFFDKSKGAFRVGRDNNDYWGDQNIGNVSMSLGYSNIASGNSSIALGSFTAATGGSSVAMGNVTKATGTVSTACGSDTWAIGVYSTAMGKGTKAPSYIETAIGSYNTEPSVVLSDTEWNGADRLFVIGNGQSLNSRSDAMVVLKNGDVGLGTSKPNEKFEIGGDGRAFFGNGQGDNRKGLLIDGIQGDGAARIEAFDYGTGTGLDLVLNTATSGGNVGIRTNSPTATLSVNGSANKTGGGSWAVFSDRRLKKDISSYEDGLSAVLAIDPVTFKYNSISKADTINEYIGVIAQELEKVSPYMIDTVEIEGTDYLEVDNSAMTYMLINAIKELNTTIEAQKAKIVDLKNENSELKAENETKDVRLDDHDARLQANTKLIEELNSFLKSQAER